MQLHPHAHLTSTQPHTTTPRWPLRAHTRRPPATEPSSIISPSQHEQHFLSHENTILSAFPTTLHSMATTPWSTHLPPPTQCTISTTTMATTHRQHSAHTAIHLTQCHPTTTVPYRQISSTSRRSRTAESTDFLPTTLLPWMSHHLEHTTALSTTTSPHRTATPPATHPILPRQHTASLSMGIPQAFLHTTGRSLPQAKEVLAKRTNSHQLLQIHSRHPSTSHLQGIGHHASPSPATTSRTTIHTQPMAASPQPFPDNT